MAMVDPKKYASEFREFLLKSNMFSLAMGVVIGAAVGKVVAAVVDDLVMPIVGVLTPSGDWRTFKLSVWRFNWTLGHFFGAVVDFMIIGLLSVSPFILRNFQASRDSPTGPSAFLETPARVQMDDAPVTPDVERRAGLKGENAGGPGSRNDGVLGSHSPGHAGSALSPGSRAKNGVSSAQGMKSRKTNGSTPSPCDCCDRGGSWVQSEASLSSALPGTRLSSTKRSFASTAALSSGYCG